MRLILLFTFFILSTHAFAQYEEIPWDEDGEVTFSEVVQVEDTDAITLYLRARQWFGKTYRKANEVLQMDEKEGGILVGKALNVLQVNIGMMVPLEVNLLYTIEVMLKDGRYKYTISDLRYESPGSRYNNYQTTTALPSNVISDDVVYKKNGKERANHASYRDSTLESMNDLIASLKQAMDDTKPIIEVDKGDDW